MNFFLRAAVSSLFLIASSALSPAWAEILHQFTPIPDDCPLKARSQGPTNGPPTAIGRSGMLSLGAGADAAPGFPPALWGGWFSWTERGAYLSSAGATLSATDLHDPEGGPITDVNGATYLASALEVMVESSSGDVRAVMLHSALYFWTPNHLYFLLVSGAPSLHEVTATTGGAIAGVRGVTRMSAQFMDMDPSPSAVNAILLSGALVYTDSQVFLARTNSIVSTREITLGGASIGGVRSVLPMGGHANPNGLESTEYWWTRTKTLEFHPDASTRAVEVPAATSTSMPSDAKLTGYDALYPAGSPMEVYALRGPAGGPSQHATEIGIAGRLDDARASE